MRAMNDYNKEINRSLRVSYARSIWRKLRVHNTPNLSNHIAVYDYLHGKQGLGDFNKQNAFYDPHELLMRGVECK